MSKNYFFGIKSATFSFKKLFIIVAWFLLIGSKQANAQWSSLGAGSCDIVYSSSPDVAGTGIYFGMNFGNACPSATQNFLQHWNGAAVAALNANCYVNGFIYAIAVSGNNVYLGGNFTTANGAGAYGGIACWNTVTNTWSTLGTGAAGSNATVYALTINAGTLYAAGEFTSISGVGANNVAAYNIGTATWSALAGGVTTLPGGSPPGTVAGAYALTYCANKLYVGGRFVNANGAAANSIAAWNGAAWSTLTGGGQIGVSNTTVVNPQNVASAVWDAPVMALTNDGTSVYVGGDFNKVNNAVGCNNIAAWNTSSLTWSTMGAGMTWPGSGTTSTDNTFGDQANVYALTMYAGNVIAGGDFMKAGTVGGANTSLFVAQWNGTAWSAMSTNCGGSTESDVFCLTVSDGILYAGGQFPSDPPNTPANMWYIAEYTGAGPNMTISVAPTNTICNGGSTVITASSGASSYSWLPTTGLSCTSCAAPTASPTITTTYTVTGTLGGCSSTKTITVVVNPKPTITLTPTSSTLCGSSSSTTITASGANTYTWSNAATLSASTGTVVTATPTATTIYTVNATDGNGCTNNNSVTITVAPLPTLTVTASSATICAGNTTTLTATGASTYTWSPAGSLSSSTGSSVNATPTVTTNYMVNATSAAGCASSQTVAINVNPLPTLTLTSSSSTICAGTTSTLTATGANTYTWSLAGSLSSSTGTPVVATPTTTTIYTVNATDNNGCKNAKTITVNTNPLPTLTLTASSLTVCTGNTSTLTAAGAVTYTWSPAGSLSSFTGTPVIATPTANTVYTVTGTDNNGCTNNKTVAINITPLPTLTLTASSSTVCAGTGTTITATGATTYTWSPTGSLSSATGTTVSATPSVSTTYTVTGTNAAGCTNSQTITINVNALPTLTLTASSSTLCVGNTSTLTAAGVITYIWSPAGSLNSSTGTPVIATPTATTVYTVTGTDNNGCKNNQTTTVNVNPLPSLTVTASPSSICSGISSTLTATGADTYTWSPVATLNTSTGSSVITTPTTSTLYTVVATFTTTGCVNTSTVNINVTPTPSLTILPSPTFTICLGDSTVINVTGGTTYTWTPAGTLSSANGSSVTATPTTTTIYNVSGIAGGCTSSSATATVIVNLPPDISAHGIPSSICIGGSSTLTAVGTAITYTWSPSGSLNTPNGTPVIASPTITTEYVVTGTGANGCTAQDSIKITVNPSPTVSIVSGGGGNSQTVCVGATVNAITFTSSIGTTINWANTNTSIGIAVTGTNTIASYTAPVVGTQQTGTITATSIDTTTGCKSDTTNPPVYVVTVNPLPIINATDSLTPGGCGGLANGCISNVAGQAPGTYQYSWNNGVTWSSNSQNCNIPAGNYVVEVQDVNGCVSQKSISLPTANAPANPSVTGNPVNTCAGDTIHLSVTSPQPHMTYTWTTSSGIQTGTTYTINNVNPAGTYTVGLAVSDTNACSNDTSFSFTVNTPPQPIISGNNHFCKGTSTVLNVTPTGPNFSYQWNLAGVSISGATASTYTATSGGTFGVAVTNTLTGCMHDTSIAIHVDSVPAAPTITTTTSNNTYCQGATINPITVIGSDTFIWYSDPTLTTQIGTGSPFTPSVTLTSTVYITASSSVCTSDSTPVVITINPIPPTPTITVGAGNNMYCQSVTPTAIVATGPATIVWYSNAGLTTVVDTGSTYAPTGLPLGTTTYYLIDSSAAGCKSAGTTTVSVTINPTPNAPVLSGTSSPYCQGTAIAPLSATTTPVGDTVIWYSGGVFQSNQNPFTPNISATPGTYTYVAYDSSATGCISAASAQTVTITINPTPTTPTITTSSIDTACQGSSVPIISATGSGTLVWFNNAALTPPSVHTGNNYTPTNLAVGTYTYYITDTSTAGCKSSSTTSVTVTIYPKPIITGTAIIDSSTCSKNNGSVTGLMVGNGTPLYTYQWVNSSGAVVGNSQNLTGIGAGTYSLIVIDSHLCRDTSSGRGVVVGGSTMPIANFIPSVTQGYAPLAVTFSNTSVGATNYGWNFGINTTTSTQTNPTYTYTTIGTYTVVLVASNGNCSDTARQTITVEVTDVLIIPNIFSPNGDNINDEFFITSSGINALTCNIFNRWGELVFSLNAPNQAWNGIMNNGNRATEGTYFYILQASSYDGKEYKRNGPLTLVR